MALTERTLQRLYEVGAWTPCVGLLFVVLALAGPAVAEQQTLDNETCASTLISSTSSSPLRMTRAVSLPI